MDAAFLAKEGVRGWVGSCRCGSTPTGEDAGFGTLSNARAVAAGLAQRPIGDTARDTLAWLATLPADQRATVASTGIARDKEAAILAAWRAR